MTELLPDSGERVQYGTGAQRDVETGKGRLDLVPAEPLLRLAQRYEMGAIKYDDHNWERGIPFSRMFSSAERHLLTARENRKLHRPDEEDHLAAVLFNVMGIMEFEGKGRERELNDLDGLTAIQRETQQLLTQAAWDRELGKIRAQLEAEMAKEEGPHQVSTMIHQGLDGQLVERDYKVETAEMTAEEAAAWLSR